ncbi:MAG: hypothetical protein LBB18_03485 [Puniceicoccales bacterium]|jgi:hypothetical protein|nr:hypothetical protein [Puniceicoccales bacterium]
MDKFITGALKFSVYAGRGDGATPRGERKDNFIGILALSAIANPVSTD